MKFFLSKQNNIILLFKDILKSGFQIKIVRAVTHLSLEREVCGSNLGQVKSELFKCC